MATADTLTATADATGQAGGQEAVPANALQQALARIRALDMRQRLAAGALLAMLIALLVGSLLWSKDDAYAVLFSNLEERDGGAIIASLKKQNIPYRLKDGGTIYVPASAVHETRLQLATEGLPKGALVGFEVMEKQKLGVSQFHEQVNFQRALEGELSRTVQSLSSVSAARVHLAIPKQSGFLRNQQKPSASVMVTLYPGRFLSPEQVAGIVHLIASSLPRLEYEQVSVVDQNGKLLTERPGEDNKSELDANQLAYVKEIEEGYIQRIANILEPVIGRGNFKAQATADVDFNRTEETSELYKPNPPPEQAIRSQQTSERQLRGDLARGVPGALTNQPPVPATAPITDPEVLGEGFSNTYNSQRTATLNYELDRTVQHVKRSVGQLRRLSVAVALNHRTSTDARGRTQTEALSDEELARITSLVREAMGFNAARGDSVSVTTAAFAPVEPEPEAPLWKDPAVVAQGMELSKYLAFALAAWLLWRMMVRPLLQVVVPPKEEDDDEEEDEAILATAAGDEDEEEDMVIDLSDKSYENRLARLRQLAQDNPKLIANIVKDWLDVEAKK